MNKPTEKKPSPIIKDWQDRWMYDEKNILHLLKKMTLKRRVTILAKALQITSDKNYPKNYAIALALDCRYEDAGYYSRAKKIRP